MDEVLLNDMLGRTVLRQPMDGRTRGIIDVPSLPTGPYVLRLKGDDRSVQRVVVRE